MTKILLAGNLLVFFTLGATAQRQERATFSLPHFSSSEPPRTYALPLSEVAPFLAWSVVWRGEPAALRVRFSPDGRRWDDTWTLIRPDVHATTDLQGRRVSMLYFEPPQMSYLQVSAEAEVQDATFHFFSPGASPQNAPTSSEESDAYACPCPKPPYLNRQGWCPAGNCPPHPNPVYTTVTHLIVHHSASSNTASDWAAVVRAIWDYHVNTNGWADIGYNWLIDPNGVLYEGRGDNVIGAHFCGANSATMGVCVIGDFTQQTPTTAALTRLSHLLAWKLCAIGAQPLDSAWHAPSAKVLPRISGHRDGCNTACPGNAFYPLMPNVRTSVANRIAQECSPAPARPLAAENVSLLVYPNPTRQTLSVDCSWPTGAWLSIFSADGRAARTRQWLEGQGAHIIDVAPLPQGLYWLCLQSLEGPEKRILFVKQ